MSLEFEIRDGIKSGKIRFEKWDMVLLFRKKVSGYPIFLELFEEYEVIGFEGDSLLISKKNWLENWPDRRWKVHKSYFVPVATWREIKLNKILS